MNKKIACSGGILFVIAIAIQYSDQIMDIGRLAIGAYILGAIVVMSTEILTNKNLNTDTKTDDNTISPSKNVNSEYFE